MATTSKVRCVGRDSSVPLRVQAFVLLMVATLEAVSVAAVMSWFRTPQTLHAGGIMSFARELVLLWECTRICITVAFGTSESGAPLKTRYCW